MHQLLQIRQNCYKTFQDIITWFWRREVSRSESFEWCLKFRSRVMSITVCFSHKITTVEIHAFVPMVCVSMIVPFSHVIAIILSQGVLNAPYCSCYLDKHKCDGKMCSNGVTSIKDVEHLGYLSVCLLAKLTDDKQNGALQIGFFTTSVLGRVVA